MLISRLGKLAQALRHPCGGPISTKALGRDVCLGDDLTVGDLVLQWLVSEHGRENAGATIGRCDRILQKLAPGEAGSSSWLPVILRSSECLALTAPGRAIYVSEGLLQMAGEDDAPIAMILAHELAHHTLGHVPSDNGRWRDWLGTGAGLPILASAQINRLLFSPMQELAADREAVAICHRAGFDLDRCLTLFDVLMRWEEGGRQIGQGIFPDWMTSDTPFHSWLRERWSGYPPLAVRREAAEVEVILMTMLGGRTAAETRPYEVRPMVLHA